MTRASCSAGPPRASAASRTPRASPTSSRPLGRASSSPATSDRSPPSGSRERSATAPSPCASRTGCSTARAARRPPPRRRRPARGALHAVLHSDWGSRLRRPDVLVEPEDVLRVVGGLDPCEAVVVGAVAAADGGVALLEQAGEVEVRLAVREGDSGVPELTRVGDVALVVGGVLPARVDAQHPLRAAVAEGGLLGADAGHRAAAVADDYERVARRPALRPVDRGLDRGVGETVEVQR